MTFNWFRRQFNDSTDPQVDKTETTSEPLQAETAEPASVEDQSQQEAADLLNYAKVAYENIRKRQQLETQATSAAVESEITTQSTLVSESSSGPPVAEVTSQATDVAVIQATEEVLEAETTPPTVSSETPILEVETPDVKVVTGFAPASEAPSVDLSPSDGGAPPEVLADEDTLVEPVVETSLKTSDVAVVSEAIAIEPTQVESAGIEASPEVSEPATPLPFWAQSEAERQARIERLRETAIEEPEPEMAQSPTATQARVAELEELPTLAFDEGFLWSAEVLAAQGRRPSEISIEEITWLKRLRQGLDKTRRSLINQLKAIVGQGPLNEDAVLEIESLLLQADVGVAATDQIIKALQSKLRDEVLPPDDAIAYLKQILREMLDKPLGEAAKTRIPVLVPEKDCLNIWLITGVNGVGKTTTIGKIAHIARKSDYTCLIAAADTFRAAAVEQVKVWGQRSGVEVIANPAHNADPAAVVFDAIGAAQARVVELLLVDTAGRLQNKKNLMDELNKVRRIIDKKAANAKVESLLVLDATLGQNGLRQAEVFSQAAQLTGVVLTKLDGTAKGGIALAVVQQLGLPIRFIGAGEGIEDLRPFSSYEFVEALLGS